MVSAAEAFMEDTRNVANEFKGMSNEDIKNIIQSRTFPFAGLCQYVQKDFNLSSTLRSMNGLGGRKLYYLGPQKQWDRRGSQGTHWYTDLVHIKDIDGVKLLKEEYSFIGVDNIEGSVDIMDFVYPTEKPILFIFGEEGGGLLPEIIEMCDHLVQIAMFGSVRSFNQAAASTVVMNDFVTKYRRLNKSK
jgi:tRNA G18 (ribose-2'-O)-methylase SpoU